MNKSSKLYIFVSLLTVLTFMGFSADSNIYENQVASSVCEGDTNIIKAGCSVAVGQIVRVTPGVAMGVTFDKMKSCFDKFGPNLTGGTSTNNVIDLNDPCNQLATLNPKMEFEKYAFVPYDPKSSLNSPNPSLASLSNFLEIATKESTSGLLMNRGYAMGETFKNVPYLKTTFAQAQGTSSLDKITKFVYDIWLLSRNVAYLILLVGALFLGITIMIGNQTIDKDGKIRLTVEKAIPRVVIAVILISSSYWVGELVLNSLVGGGIVEAFASFFAKAVFPTQTSNQYAVIIAYSAAILIQGTLAGILGSGGFALIPIIFAMLAIIWRLILLNLYIAKNILDLLIYIILSPFYIVGGVLPNENKSLIFKRYVSSLLKFIINGFLLNLIVYGSKAVLVYGYLESSGLITNQTTAVFTEIVKQNTVLPQIFIYIFSLIAFHYIIGLAQQTDKYSTNLAQEITGTKPDTKKES